MTSTPLVSTHPQPPVLRRAAPEDLEPALDIFDENVAWLSARGLSQQWGAEPFSTQETQRRRIAETLALPGAWVVQAQDGRLLGLLALGDPDPDIPPTEAPEAYVRVVITTRRAEGRGWGRRLLEHAAQIGSAQGAQLLRLDCFGGGDGELVRFYESCGFTLSHSFDDDGWLVCVMERDLTAGADRA